MGKVSKPHCSGVLTTSLVTSLQERQTAAQATTSLLPGQKVSQASTLWIISRSNSGVKLAHWLCCKDGPGDDGELSGAIYDLPRPNTHFLSLCFFKWFSELELELELMPLNSLIIDLNDILFPGSFFAGKFQKPNSKMNKKNSEKCRKPTKNYPERILLMVQFFQILGECKV